MLNAPASNGANSSGFSDAQRIAEPVVAASPNAVGAEYNRVLIELCAGGNSRLCQPREQAKGCYTVRITAEDDLTSATGRPKVLDVISKYRDTPILVWVSIPCTGGSTWQRVNREKSQKVEMSIKQHSRMFTLLFDSPLLIASHCGPSVCFAVEWPRYCDYWKHSVYIGFAQRYQLQYTFRQLHVRFGCYHRQICWVTNQKAMACGF